MQTRRNVLKVAASVGIAAVWGDGVGGETPAAATKKLTKADIDAMMKSISNWGRWGRDDQLGALNLITPRKRREAAALVKEGVSVSLAHDVIKQDLDGSQPFKHRMTALPKKEQEFSFASDEYSVQYHGYTQTHIDALCHLAYKGKMYKGFSTDEVLASGAGKLGIQQFKNGIFTRGVLMDMPRLFGIRFLKGPQAIRPEHLEAWEKKAGVRVGAGDAVLLRTGRWTRRKLDGEWDILKETAGFHASCLPWFKERDVAVVGSDLALDVLPSGVEGFEMPVHFGVIGALGMPILDCCDFENVSEQAEKLKRWAFLLTVAPLAVEGGTGSPVNPLATF